MDQKKFLWSHGACILVKVFDNNSIYNRMYGGIKNYEEK